MPHHLRLLGVGVGGGEHTLTGGGMQVPTVGNVVFGREGKRVPVAVTEVGWNELSPEEPKKR